MLSCNLYTKRYMKAHKHACFHVFTPFSSHLAIYPPMVKGPLCHLTCSSHCIQLEERFKLWRNCISQVMKANCMDSVSRQTKMNVMAASSQPGSRLPKNKKKVESAV